MIIKNVNASGRFDSCNITDLTGIYYIKWISGTFFLEGRKMSSVTCSHCIKERRALVLKSLVQSTDFFLEEGAGNDFLMSIHVKQNSCLSWGISQWFFWNFGSNCEVFKIIKLTALSTVLKLQFSLAPVNTWHSVVPYLFLTGLYWQGTMVGFVTVEVIDDWLMINNYYWFFYSMNF